MEIDRVTQQVVGAAIEVHKALGPGLLESVYEDCLAHELERRGLRTQRQVWLSVHYRGLDVERAFRVDLIVERAVIVELKRSSVSSLCTSRRSSRT